MVQPLFIRRGGDFNRGLIHKILGHVFKHQVKFLSQPWEVLHPKKINNNTNGLKEEGTSHNHGRGETLMKNTNTASL